MSAATFACFIAGRPVPQGSKTVRRGRALDANPRARSWRDQVAAACHEEAPGTVRPAFTGPVRVEAEFQFLRRASARGVRASHPVGRDMGDLDKLARGLLDGLVSGGVLRDDSQVVQLAVAKTLVDQLDAEGAHVTVRDV